MAKSKNNELFHAAQSVKAFENILYAKGKGKGEPLSENLQADWLVGRQLFVAKQHSAKFVQLISVGCTNLRAFL